MRKTNTALFALTACILVVGCRGDRRTTANPVTPSSVGQTPVPAGTPAVLSPTPVSTPAPVPDPGPGPGHEGLAHGHVIRGNEGISLVVLSTLSVSVDEYAGMVEVMLNNPRESRYSEVFVTRIPCSLPGTDITSRTESLRKFAQNAMDTMPANWRAVPVPSRDTALISTGEMALTGMAGYYFDFKRSNRRETTDRLYVIADVSRLSMECITVKFHSQFPISLSTETAEGRTLLSIVRSVELKN